MRRHGRHSTGAAAPAAAGRSERPAGERPPASARVRATLALGAVLLVAAAARLLPWSAAFQPDGVRLMADGDTYYHALRAERLARDWPHVPWIDRGMNHPYGADVPWPPLLDLVVAGVARATGPVTADHVAGVAAVVPVPAGLLLVLATAALGAVLLGGGLWWDAALLVALLPAAVRQSFVGRPDHHVLEALISAGAYLLYAGGLGRARSGWGRAALLGAVLALAFWNWSGSALYLLVLAGHVAVLHLVSPAGAPEPGRAAALLARAAAVAAVVLTLSIGAAGPPGGLSTFRLTPITGLAPVMALCTATGALVLWAARRRMPDAGVAARALGVAVAAVAPALLVLAAPAPVRAGVDHGLAALGAAGAWYASIGEFWPLVLSARQPWTTEVLLAAIAFGLSPLLLPVAAARFRQAWRDEPQRRAELAFLAVWGVATIAIAVLRRRFEGYAAIPLALAAAWAVRRVSGSVAARWPARPAIAHAARAAALALVLLPGLPVIVLGAVAELPAGLPDRLPVLAALAGAPALPGREGVLAPWSLGHEIQWFTRRPVVSTPFGTDIDPRSLRDEARFYLSTDPDAAQALLRERQIGFLLLESPVREIATLGPFAPELRPLAFEERGLATGTRYALDPGLFEAVPTRLFFFDGARAAGGDALAGYRLLAESLTTIEVLGSRAQQDKLFGVVPGAAVRVRGAAPGARVAAAVPVETNAGRRFLWTAERPASADGEATFLVPYATGSNGAVIAGPCRVASGDAVRSVPLAEAQVTRGSDVTVDLGR